MRCFSTTDTSYFVSHPVRPCITTDSPTEDSRTLNRRRVLIGLAGAGGLIGVGGAYLAWSTRGDHGGYVAPESHPVVTTRGKLDGRGVPPPETDGEWRFEDADELFVFVHGLNTTAEDARDQAYTAELGFEEIDPTPVVGYSWDSDTDWSSAKRNADANGAPLAEWLIEWAETDGRPIHLLGYSLGARVSCEALRVLAESGREEIPASVSLLGGAIPDDSVHRDGRYGDSIEAADAPVNNFFSGNDRVLGWIYRAADRTRAVGYGGIRDSSRSPSGYRDVDVTDLVADHYSYFQPEDGCLPRVVEYLE